MQKTVDVRILTFSNRSKEDRRLLKQFVGFHWQHYKNEPRYLPLLDYEYLGNKLLGMIGYFEPKSLFVKHAKMQFFLAKQQGEIVGRTVAYVNHNHNKHWQDKVGFFGFFESIDDQKVTNSLLHEAEQFLKSEGMDRIRGPQNLPVNEATPGILTEGYDSRSVIYYHFNYPYYEKLLQNAGLKPIKRILSYEVDAKRPMEEKLSRVSEKVKKRYDVTTEPFSRRRFKELRRDMFDIYNDAWNDNWGFVPFTEEEFYKNLDDMNLIMDKGLFIFSYVKGEPAGFFGAVPNLNEKLNPISWCKRCELLRTVRMFLTKGNTKGLRLGYLGVKKKFRKLGLDGVMIADAKKYTQSRGYEYSDVGWILEDNTLTNRLVKFMQGQRSKVYTVFEREIQ